MKKSEKICYLGDDNIHMAAAYLAGIMTHYHLPYDRVDSGNSPPPDFLETEYAAYVISDYPAKNFSDAQWAHLVNAVKNGSGLLMFGGWESFHGRLGEYHHSPLAEILPVLMEETDDRRNYAQTVFIIPAKDQENHPILAGLPWDTPPGIGGYNAFLPKPDATVLLEGVRFKILFQKGNSDAGVQVGMDLEEVSPVLVTGTYGEGNVAAFASDVAPHWVGGFVDWGKTRVMQEIPDAGFIEVGADYAQFFCNLLHWAKRK
ncbi:MAG: glutamine amidotransferase [Planctomycetia bacterium]|nr:glutamine amidotransferase [Planctomycetia bacterium]